MKKVSRLLMLATGIIFTVQFSSTANATTSSNGKISLATGVDVTLSAGVSAGYKATDATYAAVTVHKQGDREFGTASDLGKIVYKPVSVGTNATAPSSGDSGDFSSGWTDMGQ